MSRTKEPNGLNVYDFYPHPGEAFRAIARSPLGEEICTVRMCPDHIQDWFPVYHDRVVFLDEAEPRRLIRISDSPTAKKIFSDVFRKVFVLFPCREESHVTPITDGEEQAIVEEVSHVSHKEV